MPALRLICAAEKSLGVQGACQAGHVWILRDLTGSYGRSSIEESAILATVGALESIPRSWFGSAKLGVPGPGSRELNRPRDLEDFEIKRRVAE